MVTGSCIMIQNIPQQLITNIWVFYKYNEDSLWIIQQTKIIST